MPNSVVKAIVRALGPIRLQEFEIALAHIIQATKFIEKAKRNDLLPLFEEFLRHNIVRAADETLEDPGTPPARKERIGRLRAEFTAGFDSNCE